MGSRARSFFGLLLALVAFAATASTAPSLAQDRRALIIGNSAYSFAPLTNPANDAEDMAAALRRAGFDVMLRRDANQLSMNEAIRAFGNSLRSSGAVGLFFFAGHGFQAHAENYLLPVDGGPKGENAVSAERVISTMTAAGNGLNIVVLDSCRDNWVVDARVGTRGLSKIDSGPSLFVSFSTSPGAVALDGFGRNSPYAKHLVQAIATPDLTIEETFKRTLKGVYQETSGRQTPWISSTFFGDFVFHPQSVTASIPAKPSPMNGSPSIPALAGVYRVDGMNPDGSRYRGMLTLTRAGEQFRFNWWIGRQVFSGLGEFAGRMLVVNWGQKNPVIYSFGSRNQDLDGEWADGTATERLHLYAKASTGSAKSLEGRYKASGRSANGRRYSGTVMIVRQPRHYSLEWTVGQTSYRGVGLLEDNVLTVSWGSNTPVVYALDADGSLSGLWDAGLAEETLVPN